MDKNELQVVFEKINASYNLLSSTIDEIGKVKNFLEQIPLATGELAKTFNLVLTNVKLNEFKKDNQEVSKKLKDDIDKLDKDITQMLSHRHQFVEFIEAYKLMISRFQSTADEELKITTELMKKVSAMTASTTTNVTKFNSNMARVTTILDGKEIISKYSILNKKIEGLESKLSSIETLLSQALKKDSKSQEEIK
jgi:chorismate mutase